MAASPYDSYASYLTLPQGMTAQTHASTANMAPGNWSGVYGSDSLANYNAAIGDPNAMMQRYNDILAANPNHPNDPAYYMAVMNLAMDPAAGTTSALGKLDPNFNATIAAAANNPPSGQVDLFGVPELTAPRTYSQPVQDYVSGLNTYASGLNAKYGTYGVQGRYSPSTTLDLGATGATVSTPEGVFQPLVTGHTPYEQLVNYYAKNPVDSGGAYGGQFGTPITYNTPVRLIDKVTGKVLDEGVGFDAADRISGKAEEFAKTQGRDANWAFEIADPSGQGNWMSAYGETPNPSVVEGAAGVLPLALAAAFPVLAPGLGLTGLGGAAATGIGAALGSGLSGAISGNSIGSILKDAALSGAAAYGGASLGGGASSPSGGIPGLQESFDAAMQGLQGGLSQGIGAGLTSSVANAALGEALSEIVVRGALSSGLGAAAAQAAGAAAAQAVANGTLGAGNAPAQQSQGGLDQTGGYDMTIEVPGTPQNAALKAITGAGALGGLGLGASTLGSGASSVGTAAQNAAQSASTATNPNEIVVQGAPYSASSLIPEVGALAGSGLTAAQIADAVGAANPASTATSTGDKIVAGAKLASLLAGVLGGGGGSSSGSPGKIPAGLGGGLGEVFSKPLPTANLPGLTTGTTGARTAADLAGQGLSTPQDYYRYGYGPEQSFFNYVPQGAKNTSTAYTGYAKGGRAKTKGALSYDDLTPEEKNFVDYHRRSLAINPLEQDGGLTTVYGMQDDVPGGVMLHPGYIHGRMTNPRDMADRQAATDWARGSGIAFPVYPDIATADARETAIHHDIIEPDTMRYQRGDRSFLKGYARGGRGKPLAVKGPGTGRSDDIPAVLSDGEYVMDAETVAMLGDGSNEAGAKKLDQFRVNIRKHKGRKLAKGALSANAKAPERYLAGGRS